jgi:hypothetical protein
MSKAQTLTWAILTALGGGAGVFAGIALAHALR